ncbi:MAG: ferritin family protein [Limisphaerales bacterium]
MSTDQYHEPADELSQKTRTFARMITALVEEAEAIGWYEQRISLEKNAAARAIMMDAQKEEFKHFSMDLEFLLRQKADWRKILEGVVLVPGDIVKNAKRAEKGAD